MAVLVTRPQPDDEATAAALRARGFEVLQAPMLRFEPVAFHDDLDARYGAVIVTSANALRGIEPHLANCFPHSLNVVAVGDEIPDFFTKRMLGFAMQDRNFMTGSGKLGHQQFPDKRSSSDDENPHRGHAASVRTTAASRNIRGRDV